MNQNDILKTAKDHTELWCAGYHEGFKAGVDAMSKGTQKLVLETIAKLKGDTPNANKS